MGRITVDGGHIKKGGKFFRCSLYPAASAHHISGLHIKAADLGGRHIDIIFSRKEIRAADKAETVRHYL